MASEGAEGTEGHTFLTDKREPLVDGGEVLGCCVLDCGGCAVEDVEDLGRDGKSTRGDGELGTFVEVDVEEEGGGEEV